MICENFFTGKFLPLCSLSFYEHIIALPCDSLLAIEQFENNSMQLIQEKRYLLVSRHKHENVCARRGQTKIQESAKQKLFCVEIDRSLNFEKYISSLRKKGGNKIACISTFVQFYYFNSKTSQKIYRISVRILQKHLSFTWKVSMNCL